MKNSKRILTLSLALAITFTTFYGCKPKTSGESGEEEVQIDVVQDDSYKANFQGKTIVYSSWTQDVVRKTGESELGDASYYAMEYAKKKHNAKLEYKVATEAEYTEQFTQAALSNTLFSDITTIHSENHALWASQGYLTEVTELVKNLDPKRWNFTTSSFKNKIYGFNALPVRTYGGFPLTYNKTVLSELNLESPQELDKKGQWNWEKFREYCKAAVKDTNNDGKTDRYGIGSFMLPDSLRYSNNSVAYVFDNGKYYNANTFPTTKLAFLTTLDFMKIMALDDKSVLGTVTGGMPPKQEATEEFKANNLLFLLGGAQVWKDIKAQGANNYAPVQYPMGPQATERVNYQPGYSFAGFSKNSKYDIKDLVAFWTDASITWDQARGKAYYEPTRENEIQRLWDEQFIEKSDAEYYYDSCGKDIKTVSLYLGALKIGGIEIWDIYQKILKGEATPASVVAATEGPIQAKIDEVLNS